MVPAWPGRGDPPGDERPLFITFKHLTEDKASTKVGLGTTPGLPHGGEKPPGHHDDTDGMVPPSSWLSPPGWSLGEGDLRPELVALRARTRRWFQQTQAKRLVAQGQLPAWFHGFISRRETEELLRDQPPGCFLVRFSESTVGFVLSYRGRDRCRHFVLDQLGDGRYVILGEPSAHPELADLLRHYATAPLAPYHEFLTVPRGREDEPQGGPQSPTGSDAACPPPGNPPAYGTVSRRPPGARQGGQGGSSREAPSAPPPLPAKAPPSAVARGRRSAADGGAAPEGPHAEGETDPVAPPEPPDAKYQQLLCFHTYAEPREVRAPSAPPSRQLGDPIPFYAMGRGSTSGPEENIYSEVASAGQDLPLSFPRGSPGAFSTLPPKSQPHRRLFRSVSSQAFKGRHLPAAPTTLGKERGASSAAEEGGGANTSQEFDDPVYGRRMSNTGRNGRGRGQEGPENIYEQLLGDQP